MKNFVLRLRKKTLTEEEIATVICDTLKGLEYLHLRKKIHRDIKVMIIMILIISLISSRLATFCSIWRVTPSWQTSGWLAS